MSENAPVQEIHSAKKKAGDEKRYLVFTLVNEQYAVPLLQVKEVLGITETTPVPYTPTHFRGIMNLRGQVISIIDLRLKFKMGKNEFGPETAIIILDMAPLYLGVIVDSVDSVLGLTDEEISPSPDVETSVKTDYIEGVARKDKRLILLLNIEKTLNVEDLKALKIQTA